jgi:Curlin associated repeat
MKKITLTVGALLFTLATYAQSTNTSTSTQSGNNNSGTTLQGGNFNLSTITQQNVATGTPAANTATVKQKGGTTTGTGNTATVAQQGVGATAVSNNTANVNQFGPSSASVEKNEATIFQVSDDNIGTINQKSDQNDALLRQLGVAGGNTATFTQETGTGNQANLVQQRTTGGSKNTAELLQTGTGNLIGRGLTTASTSSGTTPTTYSNTFTTAAMQDGNSNSAKVEQVGDNNKFNFEQLGGSLGSNNVIGGPGSNGGALQEGDGHLGTVSQTRASNVAQTKQSGDNTTMLITQSNNNNKAVVDQQGKTVSGGDTRSTVTILQGSQPSGMSAANQNYAEVKQVEAVAGAQANTATIEQGPQSIAGRNRVRNSFAKIEQTAATHSNVAKINQDDLFNRATVKQVSTDNASATAAAGSNTLANEVDLAQFNNDVVAAGNRAAIDQKGTANLVRFVSGSNANTAVGNTVAVNQVGKGNSVEGLGAGSIADPTGGASIAAPTLETALGTSARQSGRGNNQVYVSQTNDYSAASGVEGSKLRVQQDGTNNKVEGTTGTAATAWSFAAVGANATGSHGSVQSVSNSAATQEGRNNATVLQVNANSATAVGSTVRLAQKNYINTDAAEANNATILQGTTGTRADNDNNLASVTQDGNKAAALVVQNGKNNEATTKQYGLTTAGSTGNVVSVKQSQAGTGVGVGNNATVEQGVSGTPVDGNIARLEQTSPTTATTDNSATIKQMSSGNSVTDVTEAGGAATGVGAVTTAATQSGSGNTLNLLQNSSVAGSKFGSRQTGTGNVIRGLAMGDPALQTGVGPNSAAILQNGTNNTSMLNQTGGNTAVVTQAGSAIIN